MSLSRTSWSRGWNSVARDRHARGNRLINKSTQDFVVRDDDLSTSEKSDNLSAGMGFFVSAETKKGKYGTINNSLGARQFVRRGTNSISAPSTFSSLKWTDATFSDRFSNLLLIRSSLLSTNSLSLLSHLVVEKQDNIKKSCQLARHL